MKTSVNLRSYIVGKSVRLSAGGLNPVGIQQRSKRPDVTACHLPHRHFGQNQVWSMEDIDHVQQRNGPSNERHALWIVCPEHSWPHLVVCSC